MKHTNKAASTTETHPQSKSAKAADLTKAPLPNLASRRRQIDALTEAVRLLLTACTGTDGPLEASNSYERDGEEGGWPDFDTRMHLEDAASYIETAHELMRIVHWLAFGPPKTAAETKALFAKITREGKRPAG